MYCDVGVNDDGQSFNLSLLSMSFADCAASHSQQTSPTTSVTRATSRSSPSSSASSRRTRRTSARS